jgi:hypothetical protein
MSKRFIYETEDQIFREAERKMDLLDREYLKTEMPEDEYLLRCDDISYWEDECLIELRSKKMV